MMSVVTCPICGYKFDPYGHVVCPYCQRKAGKPFSGVLDGLGVGIAQAFDELSRTHTCPVCDGTGKIRVKEDHDG